MKKSTKKKKSIKLKVVKVDKGRSVGPPSIHLQQIERQPLKSKKEIEEQWVSPAERSKLAKLKTSATQVITESSKGLSYDNPSASMGLIEAKVEAASTSRLWGRTVYIVQSKRDPENYYLVLDKAPTEYYCFFSKGAENGQGVMRIHSKYDTPKKQAKASNDNAGPKQPRQPKTKTPLVLEHKQLKISDLQSLQQSCIATIDKKDWVIQVRGGWCLNKQLIEAVGEKTGLIMVIKGQGYYLYPKTMWKEFDNIFASRSYSEGGNYGQSILPKKFDKHFKKF